jgi:hypothetical protein
MILRCYESQPDWKCPPLVARYPPLSTDRDVADQHQLEWVTPGHLIFEALCSVDAMTQPMRVWEGSAPYGGEQP